MEIRTYKNNETTVENGQEGRIIRKLHIARELLEMGNQIIDLKPDRNDEDHKRVVFIFKNDEKFKEDMNKVMEQKKIERAEFTEARINEEVEKRLQERLSEIIKVKGE